MSEENNDETFGQLAVARGFCTAEQVSAGMATLEEVRKLGLNEQLGSILVKKKILTREQVHELLKVQAQKSKIKIAGYEILEKVGQGGMGSVFKARQISLDRVVALKILSPKLAEDSTFCERFVKEARAVAKLNHPNIIVGIDVGKFGKYYYFAMEYVDGETALTRLRDRGPFEEAEALTVATQIAHALDHAHKHGLVHRDIKPDNIMLPARGEAKLCDLGLAKKIERDASGTSTGAAVGTPHYIAPEQARGLDNVAITADIYALGGSLYHMITGRTLFKGENSTAIMTSHLTSSAPNVRQLRSEISEDFARVLEKMLAKQAADRYQTPAELLKDLTLLANGESPEASLAPGTACSMEPTPRETGRRKGRTTGAQAVPRGTGAQAPVRGTTGPRKPIDRIPTGQRAPVDRPDQQTGPKRAVETPKIVLAAVVVAVLGAVVGIVFFSSDGPPGSRTAQNKPSAPTAPSAPEDAEKPPALPASGQSTAPAPHVAPKPAPAAPGPAKPAPAANAPPEGKTGVAAWDAARDAWRANPGDYANLLRLYEQAERGLPNPRQNEVRAEAQTIRKALDERIGELLEGRKREAQLKIQSGDQEGARELFNAYAFPDSLQTPETRKRILEAAKDFGGPPAAALAVLRGEAEKDLQAAANPGQFNALREKLKSMQPVFTSPDGVAWFKSFWPKVEQKSRALDTAALAERKKQFDEALAKAREQFSKGSYNGTYGALKEAQQRGLSREFGKELNLLTADVQAIQALKDKGVQALRGKVGKPDTVKLRHDGKTHEGQLIRESQDNRDAGFVLKDKQGKEQTLYFDTIDGEDLANWAGLRGKNPEEHYRIGTWLWWQGETRRAYPQLDGIKQQEYRKDRAEFYLEQMDGAASALITEVYRLHREAQDAKLPEPQRAERQKLAKDAVQRLLSEYATTRAYRDEKAKSKR
ncbi:MAG: protein kinase [Planctomycetes bacterium]|nr:protein kinase [Planctomycetota bacterium]